MKNFFKNLFNKTYPERVNEDISKTRIVYAGPPNRLNRRKRMQCVYAGPEMMEKMRQRRDSEMEDVYAGPPMPDEIDEPENTENSKEINEMPKGSNDEDSDNGGISV
ncbi:MAG: hypothetical protein IKP88_18590 [Lachnospiraceae bacterium]|nr:hypothetical protein [Lachnospiraceae bacterium]